MVSVEVQHGAGCPIFVLPNLHIHMSNVVCNARTLYKAFVLGIIVLVGAVALAVDFSVIVADARYGAEMNGCSCPLWDEKERICN